MDLNQQQKHMLLVTVLGVIALGGFYLWLSGREQAEATTPALFSLERPAAAPPVVQPALVVEEAATLPEPAITDLPLRAVVSPPTILEGSDKQVKLAIADLAPTMAEWLTPDQQIRKWVLSIDLMADGEVPKQYRPLVFPMPRFIVEIKGVSPLEEYFMSADNFSRADLLVQTVTVIDPAFLVRYYQSWLPLFEKAYQEQGKKDTFDQRLRLALQNIMVVKPLMITPALTKKGGVIYIYADSQYENASGVEKMMWRLGPANSAKIQDYLKQVQAELPK